MASKKKKIKQALEKVNAPKKFAYGDYSYKPMSFLEGYKARGGSASRFKPRGPQDGM